MPYILNRTTTVLNMDFQLVLRKYGLTLLHWRVLAFLNENDNLGVSALAAKTDTDQATLSRALMVLEKNGYIKRKPCHEDQRVVNIHLLSHGKSVFDEVLPLAWNLHQHAVRDFTQEELVLFNQFLNRVRTNVSLG